jgi:hypothetical protein
VKAGSGRVQECLRRNEPKLSPACRQTRAATEARLRGAFDEFLAACRRDFERLCSEVKPGSGRIVACLTRQQDDLSASCRPVIERVQGAAEAISAVREACRADANRLCPEQLQDAGALVECLQANRADLSEACRSVGPEKALVPAELVDEVNTLQTPEHSRELLQALQGLESIAFSRSQILFQVDTYEGLSGRANANRVLFNPQVVFGNRSQFQVQLKVPVIAVYPYAPGSPALTGLGAVTTAGAWAFASGARVHQSCPSACSGSRPTGHPSAPRGPSFRATPCRSP